MVDRLWDAKLNVLIEVRRNAPTFEVGVAETKSHALSTIKTKISLHLRRNNSRVFSGQFIRTKN